MVVCSLVASTVAATGGAAADNRTEGLDYVALGDSRAAGPFINTLSHRDLCMRSDQNFASKLARIADVASFTDVSCIAAQVEHVVDTPQQIGTTVAPAQLEALGPGTDPVTISIDGVDSNHVVITRESCAIPIPDGDRNCRNNPDVEEKAVEGTAKVASMVDRAIGAIAEKAPNAEIVIVGHGGAVGNRGCWPSIPYSDADAQWMVTYFERFNQVYVDAARKYGAHYIDIGKAIIDGGHDPCAAPEDKWFEGLTPTSDAQPGHFNERGMQAVADMIADELGY
ncbi:SGNH/GDSL hydrolase family protein [Rhodococcus marinonascens]|uniref:SGNH/GDSL hydrolase family protein n=1 Tax=Rhodococcus marinonascens TaxID=38311 RepID=UPI001FE2D0BA|nr:SGNH/GDSL hydrolase family protein [Rhodococcus marinonascens]